MGATESTVQTNIPQQERVYSDMAEEIIIPFQERGVSQQERVQVRSPLLQKNFPEQTNVLDSGYRPNTNVTISKDKKRVELIVEAYVLEGFCKAEVIDFWQDEILLNFIHLVPKEKKMPYSSIRFPPENSASKEFKVGSAVEYSWYGDKRDGWRPAKVHLLDSTEIGTVNIGVEGHVDLRTVRLNRLRRSNPNPCWHQNMFEQFEVNVGNIIDEQHCGEIIKKLCEDTEAIFVRYFEESQKLKVVFKKNHGKVVVSEMIEKYLNFLHSQSTGISKNISEAIDCSLNDELLKELECPVCTHYLLSPIWQCLSGHSICNKCRQNLQKCPLCEARSIKGRNYALEAVSRKLLYPCSNMSLGCTKKSKCDERRIHQRLCEYNKFPCGTANCQYIGNREGIVKHFHDETKKFPYENNMLCRSSLEPSTTTDLMLAHDELFWFKRKITATSIYWSVQYIGPTDEASNFAFQIALERSTQSGCRIHLEDYCHPLDLPDSRLLSEESCPSIALSSLKKFIQEEHSQVVFNLTIKKN